jgi:hypothetical protein
MVALLVFAPSAFGSYSPTLVITRHVDAASGDSTVDIALSQSAADDPTARLQVLSPFALEPLAAPGSQVGTFTGSALLGGSVTALDGPLVADDPTSLVARDFAKACTGTESHTAVWRLDLVPADLLVYVDAAPAAFSELAATSFQLCSPPGLEFLTATFHLGSVFQPIPHYEFLKFSSLWTAINTPREGGAVQTQSLDRWLVGTTFSAKVVRKTRTVRHKKVTDVYYSYFVRLRGSMSAGCCTSQRAIVVGDNGEEIPVALAGGEFSTLQPLPRTTVYRAVFASDPGFLEDPWTCTPLLPGTRCGTITFGAIHTTTWDVRVVRPKLTHRRIRNPRLLR